MGERPATDEILFETVGRAGLVTLNRPKALNALSHTMVKALAEALAAWANDPRIERVVIRGAGERAFCAGGDIRAVYELGKAGSPHQTDFFADEYRLNTAIKRYPKPYVALVDGISMGGGVGVSAHGSHIVASEKIMFAMPETGIGFFPDVGASYLLPRMPGRTGLYAALTSARLDLADCMWAGLATHAVGSAAMPDALDRATTAADLDAALAEIALAPGPSPSRLAADRERIDRAFEATDVGEILRNLDTAPEADAAWAAATAKTIRTKSPTSLEITFHELKRAAGRSFEDCMRLEFRIVCRILEGHDFYEGVRAVVIDKDNRPRWDPPSLADVDITGIEAHFAMPPGGDLELPEPQRQPPPAGASGAGA
jgi:enoyl-CoA hydratase